MAQTATHQRLELPILPERKGKNFLSRLADALGALKIAKENITEQYDNARDQALEAGMPEFSGERWKVTLSEVTSMRLDAEKVDAFLKLHGEDINNFKYPSVAAKVTLKPIA
jgi:hypothetical protein